MANEVKWTTGTAIEPLTNENFAAEAVLSLEIANHTNKDRFLALQLSTRFTDGVVPSAGDVVTCWVVPRVHSGATEANALLGTPVGTFPLTDAHTDDQVCSPILNIIIPPVACDVYIRNDSVAATEGHTHLYAITYNEEIQ